MLKIYFWKKIQDTQNAFILFDLKWNENYEWKKISFAILKVNFWVYCSKIFLVGLWMGFWVWGMNAVEFCEELTEENAMKI